MSNQKRKGCLIEAIRGLLGACAGFWSLLLSGCGESGEEVLNLAGKDVVLAEVNERQITLETYRQYVDRVQADLREGIGPQRYLQAIIEEELLLQEAEGLGLDQVPELAALAMALKARGHRRRNCASILPPAPTAAKFASAC